MDGFAVEVFSRLPLAQSVLRLFSYALDTSVLNDLFDRYRGRCYEDVLTFPRLAYLICDALVLHGGSGHRAFVEANREGLLPVAEQNAYGKLGRIPLDLSVGLLGVGAERLGPVIPKDRPAVVLPVSLKGFRVIAFDGKKIKRAAKRLKALRGLPGKLLGGKLLVALDLVSGLAIHMQADPDGERNDVPLVPGLVRRVRECIEEAILWIADRQFGNLKVPALLSSRPGDHFLVRCPTSLILELDPQRPARHGVDGNGRPYVEEWGWIGSDRRCRLYVRRITLDRGQEEAVRVITDLLDEAVWPARDLLDAYLQRWGIERMFQKVTEVFNLQSLIGSSPEAMIFQAAMCFVLYDIVQVVQTFVAEDGQHVREDVSTENLFRDAARQIEVWKELGDPEVSLELLAAPLEETETAQSGRGSNAAEAISAWLRCTLKGCWRDTWIKSRSKRKRYLTKQSPRAKVPRGHGGHTSTWRILQAAKAKQKRGRRS